MAFRLFGYTLVGPKDVHRDSTSLPSVVPPANVDAATTVYEASNGVFGATQLDLDQFSVGLSELDLINKYRDLALQPEVDEAIGDIINELVIRDDDEMPVSLDTDALPDDEYDETFREQLRNEFEYILHLLNFKRDCYEIVKQWYVDGRLYYDLLIDEAHPERGVQELRNIDPRTIRPVREMREEIHPQTGVTLTSVIEEYYVLNKDGFRTVTETTVSANAIKLSKDRIAYVNSGIYTPGNVAVLSYLHKAIKVYNQLQMIEDAAVIYRITRAPERRVFYVDVGDMPSTKAESYLQKVAAQYRNRAVYDSSTGQVKDDRKIQSMQEDFFMARKGNGRGTEIQTLPGGTNLGEMAEADYFRKKLYKALNIPLSRLEANQGQFTIGRATEIGRDEIKFNRFLSRLRARFSQLFDEIMCRHLTMKSIIRRPDQWQKLRRYVKYDYVKDSHFAELKELEVLTSRLNVLQQAEPFLGRFFSDRYVYDKILRLTAEEVAEAQASAAAGGGQEGDDMMGGGGGGGGFAPSETVPGDDLADGDVPPEEPGEGAAPEADLDDQDAEA